MHRTWMAEDAKGNLCIKIEDWKNDEHICGVCSVGVDSGTWLFAGVFYARWFKQYVSMWYEFIEGFDPLIKI